MTHATLGIGVAKDIISQIHYSLDEVAMTFFFGDWED
jgi:hypothetical protein